MEGSEIKAAAAMAAAAIPPASAARTSVVQDVAQAERERLGARGRRTSASQVLGGADPFLSRARAAPYARRGSSAALGGLPPKFSSSVSSFKFGAGTLKAEPGHKETINMSRVHSDKQASSTSLVGWMLV